MTEIKSRKKPSKVRTLRRRAEVLSREVTIQTFKDKHTEPLASEYYKGYTDALLWVLKIDSDSERAA